MQCHGFEPIIAEKPRVLILGTMPSVKSIADDFYYAHPRNGFWPIMAAYFQLPIESIAQKRYLIEQSELALWDVLQACERSGSLDSAIRQPIANDFAQLLANYPSIKHLFFNGEAAFKLFQKQVVKQQTLADDLSLTRLPSTSPANARMSLQDKMSIWHQSLNDAFKS